ncbi:hypothetical protein D3C80_1479860 [compost metagenome]
MKITAEFFTSSSPITYPPIFRAASLPTPIRKMSDTLHIMAFSRKPVDAKRALIIELHHSRCTATVVRLNKYLKPDF